MDLFEHEQGEAEVRLESLSAGAGVVRNLARDRAVALLAAIHEVLSQASLRNMITPGGARMSVAHQQLRVAGLVSSDRRGYRYVTRAIPSIKNPGRKCQVFPGTGA